MPPLSKDIQKSIDEIVFSIKRGVVIPIIGYDMLFNKSQTGGERDFLKQLIKKHAENDSQELKDKIFKNENDLTGYELINSYYHSISGKNERDNFKIALSETIKTERFNWQLIPESFRKLVSIKSLTFFINATFTNSLALAYNAYRAERNENGETKWSYDVLRYHPTEPDRIPDSAPSRFVLNLKKPLIYNIFGTHDEERGDYLLTDADYIELIYDLIQDKTDKFKNLVSYLNKANLLFLGCNFPDWFFRFFIRVCVGDRLDSVSAIEKKTVIDSLNNLDRSRSVFINHYKIQTLDIDCITLVDEIYRTFYNDKDRNLYVVEDQQNNNVFISYCRADEQVAKDIAAQFDEQYIQYFLDDSELTSGDKLTAKIIDAIDKCCLFLPVVSSNIKNSSAFVWKEWDYAVKTPDKIWPVYKEFVDKDMWLPKSYAVANAVKKTILDSDELVAIALRGDPQGNEIAQRGNLIPEGKLKDIKERQYDCRVSEKKRP
jgi:hypothetical protein